MNGLSQHEQSLRCPGEMWASYVILVLGALSRVKGWTGLEDEGSGVGAVEAKTNVDETFVADNIVTEEGYVVDNANGDPSPPDPTPTPIDFIDPADFLGPQVCLNMVQFPDIYIVLNMLFNKTECRGEG